MLPVMCHVCLLAPNFLEYVIGLRFLVLSRVRVCVAVFVACNNHHLGRHQNLGLTVRVLSQCWRIMRYDFLFHTHT